MSVDSDTLARIRASLLEPEEAQGLIEQYSEGQCMVLAFAMNWLTGWPVEAVGEANSGAFAHFAAVGPDGLVWDAAGPRQRESAAESYAATPAWQTVDIHKFCFSDRAGVSEDDVTEACVAAIRLFGTRLDPHLRRLPDIPQRLLPLP